MISFIHKEAFTFPSRALSQSTGQSLLYSERSTHIIDCNGMYYLRNEIGDGVGRILERELVEGNEVLRSKESPMIE